MVAKIYKSLVFIMLVMICSVQSLQASQSAALQNPATELYGKIVDCFSGEFSLPPHVLLPRVIGDHRFEGFCNQFKEFIKSDPLWIVPFLDPADLKGEARVELIVTDKLFYQALGVQLDAVRLQFEIKYPQYYRYVKPFYDAWKKKLSIAQKQASADQDILNKSVPSDDCHAPKEIPDDSSSDGGGCDSCGDSTDYDSACEASGPNIMSKGVTSK